MFLKKKLVEIVPFQERLAISETRRNHFWRLTLVNPNHLNRFKLNQSKIFKMGLQNDQSFENSGQSSFQSIMKFTHEEERAVLRKGLFFFS